MSAWKHCRAATLSRRCQRRTLAIACQVAVLLWIAIAPASAQGVTTGGITGRALDQGGLAVPGATVTISSPAMIGGARETVTDAQGAYRFTLLVPGTYRVSFNMPSFAVLNIEDRSGHGSSFAGAMSCSSN